MPDYKTITVDIMEWPHGKCEYVDPKYGYCDNAGKVTINGQICCWKHLTKTIQNKLNP